jgi:hypothetical protein
MAKALICTIADCGKPACNSRGWCSAHYNRWYRHGDPLAVVKRRGEAIRFLTETAFKHTADECLIWPFTKSKGYGWVSWNGKGYTVPRAVCEYVHGPAPSEDHQTAHLCGKGHLGCCAPSHLRWATAAENAADKVTHGTLKRGETQWRAILTEDQVRAIRALKGQMTPKDIAKRFSIHRETVYGIINRRAWKWLD